MQNCTEVLNLRTLVQEFVV